MARLALQPQVTGVVDVAPEYRMEEIDVTEGCEAAGRTIGEVRGTTTIAALRGARRQGPAATARRAPSCSAGDVLVAMGTVEALKKLESTVRRRARPDESGTVLGDRRLAGLVGRGQLQLHLLGRARLDRAPPRARERLPVEPVEQRAEQRGRAEEADLDPAELVADDRQQRPDDEDDRAADPADRGAPRPAPGRAPPG